MVINVHLFLFYILCISWSQWEEGADRKERGPLLLFYCLMLSGWKEGACASFTVYSSLWNEPRHLWSVLSIAQWPVMRILTPVCEHTLFSFLYSHLLTYIQYKQLENKGQSVHRLVNSVSILIIKHFFRDTCKKCGPFWALEKKRKISFLLGLLTYFFIHPLDTVKSARAYYFRESVSLKGQPHKKSATKSEFVWICTVKKLYSTFWSFPRSKAEFSKIILAQNSS